jgi:hypothetical protein
MHWGKASPQNQAEPNNQFRDESCAVANYSQTYQGGEMQAWGWSDARCNLTAPFICKLSRGWPSCCLLGGCSTCTRAAPHSSLPILSYCCYS